MKTAITLQVRISPLLLSELREQAEATLYDASHDTSITAADVSLAHKLLDGNGIINITKPEAASLYNEMFGLEDRVAEWTGDSDGFKWHAVHRSMMKHLERLRGLGIETNSRGWAIK